VIGDIILGHGLEPVKKDLGVKFAGDLGGELFDSSRNYFISGCWKSCPKVQVQSNHLECISISSLSSAMMMWSMVQMKQLGLILTVCPEEICTEEIVFAFGQTWLVLIFPREYTTYVLLYKQKIFFCAPRMENLYRCWMLFALARYRAPRQVFVWSVRRTFLPLQK
jgi:hypothetical protein